LLAQRRGGVDIGKFCDIIESSNGLRAGAEFYAVVARCHGGAKEETVGGSVSLDNGGAGVVATRRPDGRGAFAAVHALNDRHSS
jgi:hypothetical protein